MKIHPFAKFYLKILVLVGSLFAYGLLWWAAVELCSLGSIFLVFGLILILLLVAAGLTAIVAFISACFSYDGDGPFKPKWIQTDEELRKWCGGMRYLDNRKV
ncbi:MAG: hypothetical protein WC824_15655 [Bacteroidota bacterium]|jgi:hypothetical protein